jgi:hypothetical protein
MFSKKPIPHGAFRRSLELETAKDIVEAEHEERRAKSAKLKQSRLAKEAAEGKTPLDPVAKPKRRASPQNPTRAFPKGP